ncbi:MAG: hypothetical protein HLUCCA11_22840 [Phormidesmis priestleyi Ana]|uniref:Uncharacterized protein n=1 Tax=Phormidesmis priestleyi Ana TaxID=1666911 RepID=A0A0P8D6Z6_9CYAN|nr:MAG: hypothetical protein HLUCCA11_22840 [Phormidesmis priestleyi Ana]
MHFVALCVRFFNFLKLFDYIDWRAMARMLKGETALQLYDHPRLAAEGFAFTLCQGH